ncbi:molybdopterin molybdotransferase MoeA [Cellvibrio mixtus]|uniref:molybdopterin molybdotransferase MoeA n=1 Tax=Cellvibrio mixtus TaxID=39650 RepID=UPI0005873B8B|nr:gephyrin-like molybdotransferase Glp [Cellvibrio mixtus]
MDACVQPGLLPVHDAIARIIAALEPTTATETVSLFDGLDRVLAENIIAPINVPGADNSAMDGYAVRLQDGGDELTLIGESFAGHAFSGDIRAGQTIRIMTGGLIPAGADTVVMQENVTRRGDSIRINKLPDVGENIRRAGEDIAVQSLVLSKGHLLTAVDIGLLASLGIHQLRVFQRIKIALLTTGDELLAPGDVYQPGKIYDSNRPLLHALLKRLPVDVKDFGIVPDNPEALRKVFLSAREYADLVISTGGVSVGDADYTKEILSELGEVNFWKIAMKPGKPFAFGLLGNSLAEKTRATKCWFCGLPGNPVSTAVTYHQLVVPAVRYLAGENPVEPIVIKAVAAKPLKKQPGRMDFQRGIFSIIDGVNSVSSAGLQSSGVLSGMGKANCYIRLEAGRSSVAAGESVDVILFDRFIR